MKFLVDRCAGRRVADWLRQQGHDVLHTGDFAEDTGDTALLQLAVGEGRVVVTIDTDFGNLVFNHGQPHAGLVRLPDLRVAERLELLGIILERQPDANPAGGVVTVKGGRVRVSVGPARL